MKEILQRKNFYVNLERVTDFLLPMCFFSGSFISLILSFYLYPLFGHHETMRMLASGLLNAGITAVLGIKFIHIFIKAKNKSKILICLVIPCVWIMMYVIALFKYGINFERLFQFAQFLVFGFQMYFSAVCIVYENKFRVFIDNYMLYGLILMPFMIFYIIRLLFTDPNQLGDVDFIGVNFAGMSYMTIAYAFLPILVIMSCKIIFFDETKRTRIISVAILVLSWVVIVYTGTRGTIICVAWYLVVLAIYGVIVGRKKYLVKVLGMVLFICAFYVFSIHAWSPMASGSAGRLQDFNYDSDIYHEQSNIRMNVPVENNSNKVSIQDFKLEYIINHDQNITISESELSRNEANGKKIVDFIDPKEEKKFKQYDLYFGRNMMFRAAFDEFKKSPVVGNGPFYYQNKYNVYPHNIVLEILCDLGVVGLVLLVSVVLILLIKLFKLIGDRKDVGIIILLCFVYVPQFMVSGTVYLNYILIFSITMAFLYVINRKHDEN